MKIEHTPTATKEQILAWVKTKKPNQLAIDLLDLFWELSIEHGVDPVVVYCQSMKETGFMKFGGVLDASFHNTCGLKVTAGGGNYDPNAHKRFDTWSKGIIAHCEHLCLYAGVAGYPLSEPIDPRHFAWITGTAANVENLSGKWAGGTYGESLLKMCQEVINTKIEVTDADKISMIRKIIE